MGYGRVFFDASDDVTSKVRVVACKLMCKGGEDIFELLSIKVIPGTEKAGTKESMIGNNFRE